MSTATGSTSAPSRSPHLAAAPGEDPSVFTLLTNGLKTNRDAWNYNSSRSALDFNVTRMVEHYNAQADRFAVAHPSTTGTLKGRADLARSFADLDPGKFSWDRANFTDMARGTRFGESDRLSMVATYRPFHRRWVEAGRRLNNTVYQLPRVYPSAASDNLTIAVSTVGARNQFSAWITRDLPDVHLWIDDTPCFPLYVYGTRPATDASPGLFDGPGIGVLERSHNVTDHALVTYRTLDAAIERDDIFFYVYGILHSPDYRTAFAADLKKSLPRIPQVATAADFWAFSKAGRDLASLHIDYESVEPWPDLTYTHAAGFDPNHPDAYRVLKMKYPKVADPLDPKGAKAEDRSRIIYNDWITIGAIPERAHDYQLGSRSAIAWVMESNRVRIDKASGIRNDPNDWAIEHDDPTYILDLVGRVVTVSMRTLDIVNALSHLSL
jgi:predicted helicase